MRLYRLDEGFRLLLNLKVGYWTRQPSIKQGQSVNYFLESKTSRVQGDHTTTTHEYSQYSFGPRPRTPTVKPDFLSSCNPRLIEL